MILFRTLISGLTTAALGLMLAPGAQAQTAPATNYQLLINGKPLDVEADKEYTVTTPKGETVRLQLRENTIRSFQDEWVAFQHPAKLSVAETTQDEIRQLVLMNASGAGVLVQEYTGLDPAMLIDVMINQLSKDEIKAGYKEQEKPYTLKLADGQLLKGKTKILSQKNKQLVYDLASWSGENEGLLVITVRHLDGSSDDAANQQLIDGILRTFTVRRKP